MKTFMENIKDYLPYIVSVLVSLISGLTSYLASAKKCRTDIKTLKENNTHEINRLMEQHKLDIDSLERKHQMEIEKMEVEHKHQLELKSKDAENTIGSEFISTIMGAMLNTPEAQQELGQAIIRKPNKGRRHK